MKALYEFLRPGASRENIQYLSSARDDIRDGHSEHSVKQSVKDPRTRPIYFRSDYKWFFLIRLF